ncbi:hypothetical protein B0T10DRAFT_285379 [Thelonectria olida]|uniref:Uncharacterized protein n=1 Tax=Thelonectria olida TaxID=1576542 RepID=A0A9P9ARX3_9HYPO|nr:hypothetical protein B0T10DRAFT_285379 [Thelonectria olida]
MRWPRLYRRSRVQKRLRPSWPQAVRSMPDSPSLSQPATHTDRKNGWSNRRAGSPRPSCEIALFGCLTIDSAYGGNYCYSSTTARLGASWTQPVFVPLSCTDGVPSRTSSRHGPQAPPSCHRIGSCRYGVQTPHGTDPSSTQGLCEIAFGVLRGGKRNSPTLPLGDLQELIALYLPKSAAEICPFQLTELYLVALDSSA